MYRFLPTDVVGLAGGLQLQTVGFLFLFVRADGDDGLTPALGTRGLIAERARAEQHAVAVFRRNLWETTINTVKIVWGIHHSHFSHAFSATSDPSFPTLRDLKTSSSCVDLFFFVDDQQWLLLLACCKLKKNILSCVLQHFLKSFVNLFTNLNATVVLSNVWTDWIKILCHSTRLTVWGECFLRWLGMRNTSVRLEMESANINWGQRTISTGFVDGRCGEVSAGNYAVF